MHLTILNANFQFYQLNNCNCLSDITKLFCCRFNASEGKLFLFIFPPNWLADELTCQQICPVELSPIKFVTYLIKPVKNLPNKTWPQVDFGFFKFFIF